MNKLISTVVILLVILAVFWTCTFKVKEWETAIVLQFGDIKVDDNGKAKLYGRGLHFRWPIADKAIIMDKRIQTFDGESDRIATSEQKDLIVDSYIKWRIKDFGQFYRKTNANHRIAESRLDDTIENALRDEFGQRTRTQVVSGEREEVMGLMLSETQKIAPDLGIEVVDIRVKTINLPNEVSEAIYNRMRNERVKIANKHRAEGEKDKRIIFAETDFTVQQILAGADRKAREIRGDADAEAAKIYAETYNQNPEFYAFLRSLDAYRESFKDSDDVLVIKPESEFFKYFKDAEGVN
ncbi:protease modulator HflC [Kangiella shandongensis]|uniref:protease modulator HflC n=1 Tax=Kangiella shandongensis TaxID=2763258 RepID=UPI001CBCD120|nr:protease modulator HflC [Kangiella shandongensis]